MTLDGWASDEGTKATPLTLEMVLAGIQRLESDEPWMLQECACLSCGRLRARMREIIGERDRKEHYGV